MVRVEKRLDDGGFCARTPVLESKKKSGCLSDP